MATWQVKWENVNKCSDNDVFGLFFGGASPDYRSYSRNVRKGRRSKPARVPLRPPSRALRTLLAPPCTIFDARSDARCALVR